MRTSKHLGSGRLCVLEKTLHLRTSTRSGIIAYGTLGEEWTVLSLYIMTIQTENINEDTLDKLTARKIYQDGYIIRPVEKLPSANRAIDRISSPWQDEFTQAITQAPQDLIHTPLDQIIPLNRPREVARNIHR